MNADRASGYFDGRLPSPSMQLNHQQWEDFDPFTHEPCQTCRVRPLCRGGCPWEARKKPAFDTGHCSTHRFVIEEELRLYHLQSVMERGVAHQLAQTPEETCDV